MKRTISQEIHTVRDLLDAIKDLNPETIITVVDGNQQGHASLYLLEKHARGEGGPWDVLSIEAVLGY